jgi:SET domain-containing protein
MIATSVKRQVTHKGHMMNYRSEPVSMWFDRRIVYRKSPIHGIGTFALEDIQAGETLIWVTGGLVYTEAENAGNRQFDGTMYNGEVLSDTLRIATPLAFHYYINHSCEPNVVDQSRHPTWTHYIALRDIHANEELTADYYTQSTLDVCLCGSPACRWLKPTES